MRALFLRLSAASILAASLIAAKPPTYPIELKDGTSFAIKGELLEPTGCGVVTAYGGYKHDELKAQFTCKTWQGWHDNFTVTGDLDTGANCKSTASLTDEQKQKPVVCKVFKKGTNES